jgi:predicted kinase
VTGEEVIANASPAHVPAGEGKLVVETQPESPSVPPPELPSASPKDLKGYVVLAIGLPGSGKTTWFKRRGVTPLSSDMLRSILFDDITEQRYQGLVFSTLRSLLRARLIAKMPWNYVDATNLSAHERRQWIKMAKSFGYEAQAVFFDVPLEVCMERNSRRERTVSDDIMRKMAERLRPPSFKEGFSKITMVRVKGAPPLKLDDVNAEPPSP